VASPAAATGASAGADAGTVTPATNLAAAALADPSEVQARVLVATERQTWIYPKLDTRSAPLGYARSGAVLERTSDKLLGTACPGGFYAVAPRGYVCAAEVSLEATHVLAEALARRPDRSSGLPYLYGRSRALPPVFYNRIPSAEEQRAAEPERRTASRATAWQELLASGPPNFLQAGQTSLRFNGQRRSPLAVASGRATAGSAFAFLEVFENEGRAFGLSTDLSILPLDNLELVTPSTFAGVPLSAEQSLPLVFVRAHNAGLYTGEPGTGLSLERRVQYREAFSLTGERQRAGGSSYLQTRSGHWLLESAQLVRVDPPPTLPHWAKDHRTWIDVSIEHQTLVAYEGDQAVYATLVSTGAKGAEDPDNQRATVEGEFAIHTKHVTSTMDSTDPADSYDLRDVPYVQYFSGGTALHAAFWHDDFGAARSHGCVNLSPLDARWLFDFSYPKVPRDWHGALSLLEGTKVRVRA
jgi:hypothetical protein